MGSWSKRIDGWIPVAAGAASLAVFFPRVFAGTAIFFCRDGAGLHYAMWSYLKQRLAEHSWPLWFPYDGLGAPFIGSAISATFHPVSLLLLAFSVAETMRLAALGSFALAFAATWALARQFGCSKGNCAFAALSFTYCGALVSQVSNPTFLMAGATLPLFWLGIAKSAQGRAATGIAVGAFALALCAVAGDVQGALLMGAMAIPIYFAAANSSSRLLRAVWVVAATGAWGMALSAAQLLPAADAFRQIDRAAGLPWTEVTRWSLHPARLPELFFGDVVHWVPGSDVPNIIRRDILGSDGLWSTTLCLGVLAAFGASLALLLGKKGRRANLILLATAVLLIWLALGAFGQLYGMAYRFVPLWSAFRFPEKLVLHASLPLVLLAARGFSAADDATDEKQKRSALLVTILWLTIPAVLSCALIWSPLSAPWHEYWARLAGQGAISFAIAAAAAIVLWRGASLASLCIPLLAFLQLYTVNRRSAELCTAPSWAVEPRSEVAEALRRMEATPLFGKARVTVAFSRPGRLVPSEASAEVGTQAAAALWEREALYPDHNALFGVESIGRILPIRPQGYAVWREHASPAIWPLFNTRYIVTAPEDESRLAPLHASRVALLPGLDLAVVRLERALPRAYFAAPWLAASTEEAAARLSNPSVLSGARAAVVTASGIPSADDAEGSARVDSYQPERVELRASVARAGVLVLNDGYFEGWKAWVDGKEALIFPVNLLVRGVWLEPGDHRIVFEYPMPLALRAGIGISTATALASLALLVLALAKRSNLGKIRWRRRAPTKLIIDGRASGTTPKPPAGADPRTIPRPPSASGTGLSSL